VKHKDYRRNISCPWIVSFKPPDIPRMAAGDYPR